MGVDLGVGYLGHLGVRHALVLLDEGLCQGHQLDDQALDLLLPDLGLKTLRRGALGGEWEWEGEGGWKGAGEWEGGRRRAWEKKNS